MIIKIDSYSDLVSLKETWGDVLCECDHSVFSTWEWLSTWWKYFGGDKQLFVLLIVEKDKIVGIAPLMHRSCSKFGIHQRKLELIGTPHSDYSNFLLRNDNQKCMQELVSYLRAFSENWSSLELVDIPEKGLSTLSFIKKTSTIKPLHECLYFPLPKSYGELLRSFRRKHRKELQRNIRRLERDGFEVSFGDYSGEEAFSEGMNLLFSLHQKRWEQKGSFGVFSDHNFRSFSLDIAGLFSKKKWLGLYFLMLSAKPVAALYGFKYMSKYYAYISGMDPDYCKYSVGSILMLLVMNKCIQEKISEFDSMRGTEEYKLRWNMKTKWNFEVFIPNIRNFAGMSCLFYRQLLSTSSQFKRLLGRPDSLTQIK